MLLMTLDCPHCRTVNAAFECKSVTFRPGYQNPFRQDVFGVCRGCGFAVVALLITKAPVDVVSGVGDLTQGAQFPGQKERQKATVLYVAPEGPKPDIPDHLPDNVQRSLLDAENSYAAGHWNAAAAGYRKAVDRAVTPLVDEGARKLMLGPKIGRLEKSEGLPPAMLDWIRVVKDDGNFALHDDDRDFDTPEEIEPAREFTMMLLQFLFTMPENVRIARARQEAIDTYAPKPEE